jgi:hypothetical protein
MMHGNMNITFSLCPSVSVEDEVSQPHKEGKIIFMRSLIFMFSDSKQENKRLQDRVLTDVPRDISSLLLISS